MNKKLELGDCRAMQLEKIAKVLWLNRHRSDPTLGPSASVLINAEGIEITLHGGRKLLFKADGTNTLKSANQRSCTRRAFLHTCLGSIH